MTKDKGFTLIEMMIAIAVVGILAVVAVPSYQRYLDQASFAEVINFVAEQKVEVAEFAADKHRTPSFGEFDFHENFVTRGANVSAYSWVSVQDVGAYVIEVVVKKDDHEELIQFRGVSDADMPWLVSWKCVAMASDRFRGLAPVLYAPSSCTKQDFII